MQKHATVDQFLAKTKQWQAEVTKLRSILHSTGLDETVKWGIPVYTFDGKNIVGLGAFKSYFGLWFYQGALLADKQGVLINAQAGKTKALRQMRMQSMAEIDRKLIKAYVKEAVDLAKQGVEIKPARNKPVTLPAELKAAFRTCKQAATNFASMTLGRQREYAEYIATAKRAETKQTRIDKILPMIEAGGGLNDKYRKR